MKAKKRSVRVNGAFIGRNLTLFVVIACVSILAGCPPPLVWVPNVVGLTQSSAETALSYASLVLGALSHQYDDTVAVGQVVSETPTGGSLVSPGTPVNIVISKGPQPVTVPDLSGKTQSEAETALVGVSQTTTRHGYAIPPNKINDLRRHRCSASYLQMAGIQERWHFSARGTRGRAGAVSPAARLRVPETPCE